MNQNPSGSATPEDEGVVLASAPTEAFEDPAMTDAGPSAPHWTAHIPVSINDAYGDPLIPEQINNTTAKIASLHNHHAPIGMFTKAGYSDAVLRQLSTVAGNNCVVVFYSLTGLDEGGIGFAERLRFIAALRRLFPNSFVFTRPIIRNRNDSPEMLRRLAHAAAELTGQLVLGGVHDATRRKRLDVPVEELLIHYCDEVGVRSFFKTSCAAAWAHSIPCWVHDLGAPRNTETLRSLGYAINWDNSRTYLEKGSTGDINFIRMVSGADVWVRKLLSNYNLLTLPTGGRKLETHSSWFAWSDNIETCLDCNYCIIKQIEYLQKMRVRVGVHPSRIPEVVSQDGIRERFDAMRLTRLPASDADYHTYGEVRTEQPCRAGLYTDSRALVRHEPWADCGRRGIPRQRVSGVPWADPK